MEAFGPDVLTPEGTLDRPRLGSLVFGDPERLAVLNGIVHPLVRARSAELPGRGPARRRRRPRRAPARRERAHPLYDVVVVVDASVETRLERLVRHRGMTESEARARMAAQATSEERRAVADHVIDNDGPLTALEPRVRAVWEELAARAARAAPE